MFYTIALTFFYSVVPYKTPWCMLGFLHGMILVAGIGCDAIARLIPWRWLRWGVTVALLVPVGQLGWQAWRVNYVFPGDYKKNPYVYSQPVRDVEELGKFIDRLAEVHPAGKKLEIEFYFPTDDHWPLPWYLRGYEHVAYHRELSGEVRGDVVVADAALAEKLNEQLGDGYFQMGRGLRSKVIVAVYVKSELMKAFQDRLRANSGKQ